MARRSGKRGNVAIIPRRRRDDGVLFGRSTMGVPGGELTDFGCPDCRGVLAVREEGDRGHLSFSCRVAHVYSGESLMKEKEEQLENSLWASVEVFEELVLLHQELAARARRNQNLEVARAYERRSKRALTHIAALRAIISQDAPATADGRQR